MAYVKTNFANYPIKMLRFGKLIFYEASITDLLLYVPNLHILIYLFFIDKISSGTIHEEGCFVTILKILSYFLIIVTFPFSLCLCVQTVQEYERAIIFRLGRIKSGGVVGPGLFFIIPCMDSVIILFFHIYNCR